MKDLEYTNTQRDQIRRALDNGETLTAMDVIKRFGCTKLATRISELKRVGYPVVVEMVHPESGNPYAKYHRGTGAFIPTERQSYSAYSKDLIHALDHERGCGIQLAERLVKEDYEPICRGFYKCETDASIAAKNLLQLFEDESDADLVKEWENFIEWIWVGKECRCSITLRDDWMQVEVKGSIYYFCFRSGVGIFECDKDGVVSPSEIAMDSDEAINYVKSLVK